MNVCFTHKVQQVDVRRRRRLATRVNDTKYSFRFGHELSSCLQQSNLIIGSEQWRHGEKHAQYDHQMTTEREQSTKLASDCVTSCLSTMPGSRNLCYYPTFAHLQMVCSKNYPLEITFSCWNLLWNKRYVSRSKILSNTIPCVWIVYHN